MRNEAIRNAETPNSKKQKRKRFGRPVGSKNKTGPKRKMPKRKVVAVEKDTSEDDDDMSMESGGGDEQEEEEEQNEVAK
jgi:hypothetical protein